MMRSKFLIQKNHACVVCTDVRPRKFQYYSFCTVLKMRHCFRFAPLSLCLTVFSLCQCSLLRAMKINDGFLKQRKMKNTGISRVVHYLL